MPLATGLSFVGVAKEVTRGTVVAPTAFIPCKTIACDDTTKFMTVEAFEGDMAMNHGVIQGFKPSSSDLAGPLFPDTFPWVLAGLLGDLVVTGTTAPFSNALSLLNTGQPTSHTVTDFYGVTQARSYPGTQWASVEIKGASDALIEYTAKGLGFASSQVAKPAASFTGILPLPSWATVTTIGGVAIPKLTDWTVTITRKDNEIDAMNGTQIPTQQFLGLVDVKIKFTAFIDDDTELTRMLTNTQPSFDLTATSGTGATLTSLEIHCSQAAYTVGKKNAGKDYMAIDIEADAVANTTDVGASGGKSPIKVTVQNAVNGGYV